MDRRKSRSEPEAKAPGPETQPAPARNVGEKLRAMFQAVEAAPVPDEITRLVEELEHKRRGRRKPRSN
jgi:hypothetical protein